LSNFKYYSSQKVNDLVQILHSKISDYLKVESESIWFIPVGYVAKSGGIVAYFYKKNNNIKQDRIISLKDLENAVSDKSMNIVFLDDFIGSGHQAASLWNVVEPLCKNKYSKPVIFASLVGYEKGINYLNKYSEFKVINSEVLPSSLSPLSEDSVIFENEEDRQKSISILRRYGESLFPDHPFGYAQCALLVGFFYSTPTNTLPIFWAYKSNWKPLLPRGESFIDAENLITPPAGLEKRYISKSNKRAIFESGQLDKYKISSDMAIKIFREFRHSSIYLVLAPILEELDIDEDVLNSLLDVIENLKYTRRRNKPVCTSVLIISESFSKRISHKRFISVTPEFNIRLLRDVINLAYMVNGFDGAVVAKADGSVMGNILFAERKYNIDYNLPDRYHKAAGNSMELGGLLFLFNGEGRVNVFYKGNRIISYRRKTWHIHPAGLRKGVKLLADKHNVDFEALHSALKYAYELSDSNLGGIITIGDYQSVLKISDLSKKYITCEDKSIKNLSDKVVLNLMSKRGAVLIDNDGKIIQGMTFLRPPKIENTDIDISKESKYNTGAKVSYLSNAICIVVSLDGNITVYSKGKIVFKIMG